MLWAVAHLISNGMLADVVLFGAFLVWAVADRISYTHRTPRPLESAPPAAPERRHHRGGGSGVLCAIHALAASEAHRGAAHSALRASPGVEHDPVGRAPGQSSSFGATRGGSMPSGRVRKAILSPLDDPVQRTDHSAARRANEAQRCGIVVGIIEPSGQRIVTYGKSGAKDGRPLDGDTVFQIGSVTKSFTGLLLADMVVRGEVKLDDPAAKYLPQGVSMPTTGAPNARPITLHHLATHMSGLPSLPNNFDPYGEPNPLEAYTADNLYRFLSTRTSCRANRARRASIRTSASRYSADCSGAARVWNTRRS